MTRFRPARRPPWVRWSSPWPSASSSVSTRPAGRPPWPRSTPCATTSDDDRTNDDTDAHDSTQNETKNWKEEARACSQQPVSASTRSLQRRGSGSVSDPLGTRHRHRHHRPGGRRRPQLDGGCRDRDTGQTRPRRQRQRGGPRRRRVEHGGAEHDLRPDHGELDVDDGVLQDGHRGGQARGRRRLRQRDRDALEEVQDDDRGPLHHRDHGQLERFVHRLRCPYVRRRARRCGGGFRRRERWERWQQWRSPGFGGSGGEGGGSFHGTALRAAAARPTSARSWRRWPSGRAR